MLFPPPLFSFCPGHPVALPMAPISVFFRGERHRGLWQLGEYISVSFAFMDNPE